MRPTTPHRGPGDPRGPEDPSDSGGDKSDDEGDGKSDEDSDHGDVEDPEDEAAQLTAPELTSLAPLLPNEGLHPGFVSQVRQGARLFDEVLAGRRPAGRLFRDDEMTTYAFDWHRHRAIVVANRAMRREMEFRGDDFNVESLTSRATQWVILTEMVSLTATWIGRPQVAHAAATAGSALRSGYWLWLEDDDRAMAALRTVLEQTARMRVWRRKPDKAANLDANLRTRPRDWLEAAGWKRLSALNKALGEMAHTKATSKWGGARELLARLQIDIDPEVAIFTARGAAMDFTASLLAAEVLEQLALLSDPVQQGARKAFIRAGIQIADPTEPDIARVFDHMWSQRSTTLGQSDFEGPAQPMRTPRLPLTTKIPGYGPPTEVPPDGVAEPAATSKGSDHDDRTWTAISERPGSAGAARRAGKPPGANPFIKPTDGSQRTGPSPHTPNW